jgi:hypothetical protein
MANRCSWCYKTGHNKLSCPERKKQAKENPGSYLARQVEREQAEFKHRAKNRSCSYCGHSGHNRRGCQQRKDDIRLSEELAFLYRKRLAKIFQDEGISIGSLIEVPYYKAAIGIEGKPAVGRIIHMIEKINWEHITHRLAGPDLGGVRPRNWRLDGTTADNSSIETRIVGWDFNVSMEELRNYDYYIENRIKLMARSSIPIVSFFNEKMTPSIFDVEKQSEGQHESRAEHLRREPHKKVSIKSAGQR